jgi:hypothetical protein
MAPRSTTDWRGRVRRLLAPFLCGLVLGGLLGWWERGDDGIPGVDDGSAQWTPLDRSGGMLDAVIPVRVAAIAPGPGGRDDIYLAWARLTDTGEVISLYQVSNISRSPSIHETQLITSRGRLAYASTQDRDGEVTSVELLLPGDEAPRAEGEWSGASERRRPSPTSRPGGSLGRLGACGSISVAPRMR